MSRLVGFLVILVAWELLALRSSSPAVVAPHGTVRTLVHLITTGEIWPHVLTSMQTVILGVLLAFVVGFLVGVAVHESRLAERVAMPSVDAMRAIAPLSLYPILIVTFGLGQASKAFVIFWAAWPAVLLATVQGLNTVRADVVHAAASLGASRWTRLVRIKIPLALLSILTGLRIAMTGGWVVLVTAEMLGASKGLGYFVWTSAWAFQFPSLYAGIVAIALCGLLLNQLLWGAQRALAWRYPQ